MLGPKPFLKRVELRSDRFAQVNWFWRYLFTVLLVCLVAVVRFNYPELTQEAVWAPFMAALFLAAFFGGTGPAVLAALLSAALHIVLFTGLPLGGGLTSSDWAALGGFAVMASLFIGLTALRRRMQVRFLRTLDELSDQTEVHETILKAQSDLGEAFFIITGEKIVYANEACSEISGYSQDELKAFDNFLDLVYPDQRDLIVTRMLARLSGEQVENYYETKVLYKDGHPVDIEVAVQVLRQQGQQDSLLVMARDISDRKRARDYQRFMIQASQELGNSLDYNSTLKEVARIAVPAVADWCAVDILNDEGKLERLAVAHTDPEKVEWAWEIHRQYPTDQSSEEGVAKVLRTGQPEFYSHIPEELVRAAARDERHWEILQKVGLNSVLILPLKAGEKVFGVLTLIYAESGRHYSSSDLEVMGALAARAGIAIQNAKLYSQTKYFEAMVENSAEAIFSKDAFGKVLSWNKGAVALYGYSREEMVGSNVSRLVPEDRQEELQSILARIRSGQTVKGLETKRQKKTGEIIDVILSITPVTDPTGKIVGGSTVARDITAEKAIERQKDEFISVASHELKTPITSLKVFSQTLLRSAQRASAKELDLEKIHAIDRQIDRLIKLIRNILDVSRIGAEQLELNPRNFNLRERILELADALQPVAADHELVLRDIPDLEVFADPERLDQVITNLVTNAAQHSPAGTEITISGNSSDDQVIISVKDRGEGIEPTKQKQLFEKFYQVQNKSVGAGLGLYIARRIVELHQGKLHLNSVPGQGSTFYVALPLKPVGKVQETIKEKV